LIGLNLLYHSSDSLLQKFMGILNNTNPYVSIVAGDFNSPPHHGFHELMQSFNYKFNTFNSMSTHSSGEIDHVYLRNYNDNSTFVNHCQDTLSSKFLNQNMNIPYGDHIPRFFTINL